MAHVEAFCCSTNIYIYGLTALSKVAVRSELPNVIPKDNERVAG